MQMGCILQFLPRDAMVVRYICCRHVSVRHTPVLYENGYMYNHANTAQGL